MRVAFSVDLSLHEEGRIQKMQVILSEADLESAPAAIQEWIIQKLKGSDVKVEASETTGVPKNVSKAKKEKAVDATAKEPAKVVEEPDPFGDDPVSSKPVTHDDVRVAGMNFVKTVADGKTKLLAALAKVGAANIKECPQDKLADLLAMLTVA